MRRWRSCGQIGIQLQRALGRFAENLVGHHRGRRASERQDAGCHLVQHDAEREQIAPCVQAFASHLLRRHVRDRSQRRPGAGQMRLSRHRRQHRRARRPLVGSSLASPKSRSLACPREVTKMLPGLMSRCTTPARVRCIQRVGNVEREREQLVHRAAGRLPAHPSATGRRATPSR